MTRRLTFLKSRSTVTRTSPGPPRTGAAMSSIATRTRRRQRRTGSSPRGRLGWSGLFRHDSPAASRPPTTPCHAGCPRSGEIAGGVSSLASTLIRSRALPVSRSCNRGSTFGIGRDHVAHRRRHIVWSIEQQLRTGGHAGIVLHPRCLWLRSQQRLLIALLDHLEHRGLESRSLRQIATDPPAEHECMNDAVASSSFREGLRGLFSWISGRS